MGLTSRLLAELGATPERLGTTHTVEALDSLKAEARQKFKALAFKYHPDRHPGDDGLLFRALNEAFNWLLSSKVTPPVMITTTTYMCPAPSYFDRQVSPKRVYDARRVVSIRPT